MKRILVLILVAFSLSYCTNGAKQTEGALLDKPVLEVENERASVSEEMKEVVDENAPVISLDNAVYEFGTVKEGDKVEHVYSFTNTGKSPLIISNVSASCGCTTPEYSKHPINPGEKGSITVVFNSQNQVGMQQKIITVLSNAEPSRAILQLKGEVKK
jgi:hypothetical protein